MKRHAAQGWPWLSGLACSASRRLSLAGLAATSIVFFATKALLRQTRVFCDKTRLLSRQKYACPDKMFVATNTCLSFVATKLYLLNYPANKTMTESVKAAATVGSSRVPVEAGWGTVYHSILSESNASQACLVSSSPRPTASFHHVSACCALRYSSVLDIITEHRFSAPSFKEGCRKPVLGVCLISLTPLLRHLTVVTTRWDGGGGGGASVSYTRFLPLVICDTSALSSYYRSMTES